MAAWSSPAAVPGIELERNLYTRPKDSKDPEASSLYICRYVQAHIHTHTNIFSMTPAISYSYKVANPWGERASWGFS